MKERIIEMIAVLESRRYDPEDTHMNYDKLLEDFILNFDHDLLPLMRKLLLLPTEFWYA